MGKLVLSYGSNLKGSQEVKNRKVGKPIGDVTWFHSTFEHEDSQMRRRQHAVEEIFSKGPGRNACVICGSPITLKKCYKREKIIYAVCDNCEHINGMNEMTDEFVKFCYSESEEEVPNKPYEAEFSSGKMFAEYEEVVTRIYKPKSEFLIDSLSSLAGVDPKSLKYLDFGCGSGHFLKALKNSGCEHVKGVDSLQIAVDTASSFGLGPYVESIDTNDYLKFLSSTQSDVVSMMCVLPHLQEPTEALKAMKSGGVKWTFQKLPMWSFAVWLESGFPEFRSRVLGSDHTNVFTWKSLDWLEEDVGMKRISAWSFGSDSLDLIRKVRLLQKRHATTDFVDWASEEIMHQLDKLQLAIDEMGMSSEIHVLWQLN